MTDHRRALRTAIADIDLPGTLAGDPGAREHLAACAACRAAVDRFSADARAIRDLPAPAAPARIGVIVAEAARRSVRRRPILSDDVMHPLLLAATIALLTAALVGAAVAGGAALHLLDGPRELSRVERPLPTAGTVVRSPGPSAVTGDRGGSDPEVRLRALGGAVLASHAAPSAAKTRARAAATTGRARLAATPAPRPSARAATRRVPSATRSGARGSPAPAAAASPTAGGGSSAAPDPSAAPGPSDDPASVPGGPVTRAPDTSPAPDASPRPDASPMPDASPAPDASVGPDLSPTPAASPPADPSPAADPPPPPAADPSPAPDSRPEVP